MAPPLPSQAPTRAVLSMLAGVAVLTAGDAVTKLLTARFPVGQVLCLRHVAALACLIAYVRFVSGWPSLAVADRLGQLTRGLMFVGTTAFMVLSLSLLPLPIVIALSFSSPILVAAVSQPMLGEKVSLGRWLAVLVGFAGVLVILRPGSAAFDWALLLPLGAAVAGALRDSGTRRLSRTESSISILFWSTVIVIIAALPFALWQWRPVPLDWAGVFLLCGFLSAAAHFLIVDAFRYGDAALVAPLRYTGLVWAIVLALFIWRHLPDGWSLAGSALIVLSGLGLIERRKPKAA